MKFYNEFWVNGKLKSEEITPISPRDRSFSLGDGLFETVKIIGKKALNWDSHMERLSHGLNFCKFNTEVSSEELLGGIAALINKTGNLMLWPGLLYPVAQNRSDTSRNQMGYALKRFISGRTPAGILIRFVRHFPP